MDSVNCPLLSYQILRNGAAYTGTCIVLDPSGQVLYNGEFCEEDNIQVKVNTVDGQSNTHPVLFKVFVKPLCPPNLKVFYWDREFISLAENSTDWSLKNVIFSGGDHFLSFDTVNCPILSYELL